MDGRVEPVEVALCTTMPRLCTGHGCSAWPGTRTCHCSSRGLWCRNGARSTARDVLAECGPKLSSTRTP
eukprot:8858514-Pyramimonas_sp.AAC.1